MSLNELREPKVVLIYARPGHGKTTLIKRYLRNLNYHHLYIISASTYDDYSEGSLVRLGLNPETVKTTSSFNWEEVDEFRNKEGIKVLILDDVLHLELTSGKVAAQVRDLLSTSRHKSLYIIIGVQLLKSLGKAIRMCAHIFITGSIDQDSVELLSALSGKRKTTFMAISLKPHYFLYATVQGKVAKIEPMRRIVIEKSSSSSDDTSEDSDNTNKNT